MASQSETNQYINISIDEGGSVYFIPSAPSLWVLSSAILVEFPRSSLGIRKTNLTLLFLQFTPWLPASS